MFGVVILSQIPLRAEARHASEMVSQLLFGDPYQVLETADEWVKIETCDDQYQGWIDKKVLHLLNDAEFNAYLSKRTHYVREPFTYIFNTKNAESMLIFRGSSFPFSDQKEIVIGDETYVQSYHETMNSIAAIEDTLPLEIKKQSFEHFIEGYLNTPYLWGGKTPAGIDCSGFVQMAYKSVNIGLPRDASQQALIGESIAFENSQATDVAFFANKEGRITHTGIILDNNTIIHASLFVKKEKIDKTGIISAKTGEYTHYLHSIKRYWSCF